MTIAWFEYYCLQAGMTTQDFEVSLWKDILDCYNCYMIDKGYSLPSVKKKKYSYDEAIALL